MSKIKKFDSFINEGKETLDSYEDLVCDTIEEIGKGLTDELVVNMMTNHKTFIKKCFEEDKLDAKECAKEILKKDKTYLEINENVINEDADGHFGVVNIHIDGHGFIKESCIPYIKKALGNFQGERHIFVDGVEVNPYR